jgi:hypothetical protein
MSSNNPYAGMTYEELLKNAPPIKRKARPPARPTLTAQDRWTQRQVGLPVEQRGRAIESVWIASTVAKMKNRRPG